MRDRLIELLNKVQECGMDRPKDDERYPTLYPSNERVADHLLAAGVIVPPIQLKQTVWVYNQMTGKIYPNTVVGINIKGTSPYKKAIKLEYINKFGEMSCRKFTWAQIGKQVFLTEKEAEKALAESEGAEDE